MLVNPPASSGRHAPAAPAAIPPRPRIGLIADGDARSPDTMSGTPYYCAEALRTYCGEVEILECGYRWFESALRYLNGATERVTRRRYSRAHSLALARLRSHHFARQAGQAGCDLIFSAKDCKGVAFLPPGPPVIYWSDATFRSMLGYYPSFSTLYSFSRREGEYLERRALRRADHVVMLSGWAAASAVTDYGVPAGKISTFPYGPKLQPGSEEQAARKHFREGVRLLWVGNKWQRKGGAAALEVAENLRARGIPALLTVIGTIPPVSSPALRVIPYLSKKRPNELEQLRQEYLDAHFFIMPTRQEAGGSVFVEATSFGLPSLGSQTGGVQSLIRQNVNGFALPVDTPVAEFADLIQGFHDAPENYRALVERTWTFHRQVANWEAWGRRISGIVNGLVKHAQPVTRQSA